MVQWYQSESSDRERGWRFANLVIIVHMRILVVSEGPTLRGELERFGCCVMNVGSGVLGSIAITALM